MANRHGRMARPASALAAGALAVLLGAALAQEPAPKEAQGPPADQANNPKGAPPKGRTRGGLRAPGGAAPKKGLRKDTNALPPVGNPGPGAVAGEPQQYTFRLSVNKGTPLAATYYPSKLGTNAAVVLLIHEKNRSTRDFQEPIADLKKKGLAETLQADGYAVLAIDLPGQGANPRRELADRDWRGMVDDLQTAYKFLVDRHNRGELNLARLGVVGVGEGANLAAVWAASPGAAVTGEGRTSDVGALVLVSPMSDDQAVGLRAGAALTALAPRAPILILAGERDAATTNLLNAARPIVERARQNQINVFPTSLHGYKLLWLEPKAASAIGKFLEGTTKFRAQEWEPRYNLQPATYSDIRPVTSPPPTPIVDPARPEAPEKKDQS